MLDIIEKNNNLIKDTWELIFNEDQQTIVIGRSKKKAQKVIKDDENVSRKHLALKRLDLKSANGTFLNKKKLHQKREYNLNENDIIWFGENSKTEIKIKKIEEKIKEQEITIEPIIEKKQKIESSYKQDLWSSMNNIENSEKRFKEAKPNQGNQTMIEKFEQQTDNLEKHYQICKEQQFNKHQGIGFQQKQQNSINEQINNNQISFSFSFN